MPSCPSEICFRENKLFLLLFEKVTINSCIISKRSLITYRVFWKTKYQFSPLLKVKKKALKKSFFGFMQMKGVIGFRENVFWGLGGNFVISNKMVNFIALDELVQTFQWDVSIKFLGNGHFRSKMFAEYIVFLLLEKYINFCQEKCSLCKILIKMSQKTIFGTSLEKRVTQKYFFIL